MPKPLGTVARQFTSFVSAGAIGFLIDASIFLTLTQQGGWSIPWARALSALCSITATWIINRHLTFAAQRSRNKGAEYTRYLLAQIVGLAINLGTFAVCLAAAPTMRRYPIVALVVGASTALLVNFLTARSIAFRTDHSHGNHQAVDSDNTAQRPDER